MDPSVQAAWIAAAVGAVGISSSTVIAVTAARNSRRANTETIAAAAANTVRALAAARAERIWDQRAAVYGDVIVAINYRLAQRDYETRASPLGADADQRRREYLATYKPADLHAVEGRLAAFGSVEVLRAMIACVSAHDRVMAAFREWQEVPGTERLDAVHKAQDAAGSAETEARNLIRDELQGSGRPVRDWIPQHVERANADPAAP